MAPVFRLPPHFGRERERLEAAGITGDAGETIDHVVGRAGGASEARLIRLRGQARLVVELNLEPPDAALLLHAGIATAAGLRQADPHRLLQQIHRLQRQLTGAATPLLDMATLRRWMVAGPAQEPGRSGN